LDPHESARREKHVVGNCRRWRSPRRRPPSAMTAWPCCPCWTPRSGASTPELVRLWGSEPRVQRLLTIPGIGPFLAILLVLELGDVQRFPSAKHLASYIGLTPRIRASADAGPLRPHQQGRQPPPALALVLAATQAARRP